MATNEQIEDLKRQWLSDPCWDIETTDGFEAHRQELHIWRLETENAQLRSELAEIAEFRRKLKEFIG